MILDLDERTRIASTSRCWQMQQLVARKGKGPSWEPFKYFTTLTDALGAALERDIKTDESQTLAETVETIKELVQKHIEVIRPIAQKHDEMLWPSEARRRRHTPRIAPSQPGDNSKWRHGQSIRSIRAHGVNGKSV